MFFSSFITKEKFVCNFSSSARALSLPLSLINIGIHYSIVFGYNLCTFSFSLISFRCRRAWHSKSKQDFSAYQRIELVCSLTNLLQTNIFFSSGLFAADTIHEVKPTRNHLVNVPALSPQFRQNGTVNVLFASAEQNRHQLQQYQLSNQEIQQYYGNDDNLSAKVDSSNDSRWTSNGIRNGFRPSTIRHQRMRLNTAASQRTNQPMEARDTSAKSIFPQTPASAKLRSEINHIHNKLLTKRNSTKSLRLQNNQVRHRNSNTLD